MQSISLGILGGGNMARALIRGLLVSELMGPDQIVVSDVREDALKQLKDEFSVATETNNQRATQAADVVLVAVKPQVMPQVLEDLKASYRPEQLLISIAAGVATRAFVDVLGAAARIVRAMPNTPALVLEAATALAPGGGATPEDIELASKIFGAVGSSVVLDEAQLDAVTGLSGSGPGYVMLIAQALADAGVKMGLSRQVSQQLVAQTLYGSAKLLLESGEHPAVLKDRVASPGGTTITGLCALEEAGLPHALISAVSAATEQSKKLGKR